MAGGRSASCIMYIVKWHASCIASHAACKMALPRWKVIERQLQKERLLNGQFKAFGDPSTTTAIVCCVCVCLCLDQEAQGQANNYRTKVSPLSETSIPSIWVHPHSGERSECGYMSVLLAISLAAKRPRSSKSLLTVGVH